MSTTDCHNPNWAPLEALITPVEDCAGWMWMGTVRRGHHVIEQYKHRDTRRYLNLDQDGQAWTIRYSVGCDPWCDRQHQHVPDPPPDIDPIPVAEALNSALAGVLR